MRHDIIGHRSGEPTKFCTEKRQRCNIIKIEVDSLVIESPERCELASIYKIEKDEKAHTNEADPTRPRIQRTSKPDDKSTIITKEPACIELQ